MRQSVNVNLFKDNQTGMLRNLRIGFIGQGQMFGENDAVRGVPYGFSLRTYSASCSLYLIKSETLLSFINNITGMKQQFKGLCEDKTKKQMEDLVRVVFSKWSVNRQQQSQTVVRLHEGERLAERSQSQESLKDLKQTHHKGPASNA